jgi:hypothetical protein
MPLGLMEEQDQSGISATGIHGSIVTPPAPPTHRGSAPLAFFLICSWECA